MSLPGVNGFTEDDYKMYELFSKLIANHADWSLNKLSSQDNANITACLKWYTTIGQKIKDNSFDGMKVTQPAEPTPKKRGRPVKKTK